MRFDVTFKKMTLFFLLALAPVSPALVFCPLNVAYAEPPKRPEIPKDVRARYFMTAVQLKDRMLADYKAVLEAYYELKKKSGNPATFTNYDYDPKLAADMSPELRPLFEAKTVARVNEFDYDMYLEFQSQLDSDPRLKGNLYLAKHIQYGSGRANDVFQRLTTYTFEAMNDVPKDFASTLRRDLGSSVSNLGMLEAIETFNVTSHDTGFSQNFGPLDLDAIHTWSVQVDVNEQALKSELKKIGYIPRPRAQIYTSAGTCANAFSKLAK